LKAVAIAPKRTNQRTSARRHFVRAFSEKLEYQSKDRSAAILTPGKLETRWQSETAE
jgi:hypothetical protein